MRIFNFENFCQNNLYFFRNAATKFLLSAKFVLEVDLEDVKSAISTATCPGFFFGLGHAKMSCHIKPGLKGTGTILSQVASYEEG